MSYYMYSTSIPERKIHITEENMSYYMYATEDLVGKIHTIQKN